MAKAKATLIKVIEPETHASISVRDVPLQTWKDFKKLAMLHELTIAEYLTKIVDQEMKHVSISNKS